MSNLLKTWQQQYYLTKWVTNKDSNAYVPVPLSTTPMKNMSVSFASPASDTCSVYGRSYKFIWRASWLEKLTVHWEEPAEQSASHLIVFVGDGGPTGQAGHDLGWEEVLALAGDWDDAVLCGGSGGKLGQITFLVPLEKRWTVPEKPTESHPPKEANCLVKAWRERSRPLRSFMVLSIWLALSELPPRALWPGKKRKKGCM